MTFGSADMSRIQVTAEQQGTKKWAPYLHVKLHLLTRVPKCLLVVLSSLFGVHSQTATVILLQMLFKLNMCFLKRVSFQARPHVFSTACSQRWASTRSSRATAWDWMLSSSACSSESFHLLLFSFSVYTLSLELTLIRSDTTTASVFLGLSDCKIVTFLL